MNFFTFTKLLRVVVLLAALAVGAVGLSGCGDDNGANSGGGSYASVEIGGMKWMKTNLNVKTANSWCFADNTANCDKYGRLYTWAAAKSACQSAGWRLPTRDEWGQLAKAAGGTGAYGDGGTAGKALKSTSGWYNNGNGTDTYGFSALPGGGRDGNSVGTFDFKLAGSNGKWWTATEDDSDHAYSRYMEYGNDNVEEYSSNKSGGKSVRCIKD